LVWQFKAGGPITSSPAVREGVVYFGAGDGVVYALDALQGTLRWQYEIDSWVHSSPAISEEFVAVGGRDGFVYTFETQRAERHLVFTPLSWPIFQPEEHPRGVLRLKYDLRRWPVDATPAIVGNTVYIGADDGHVRALDATVSIPQWRQVVRELQSHLFALGIAGPPGRQPGLIWDFTARGRFTGGVAVTERTVFAASSDGRLYAIDRETGAPAWGWTEQQAPTGRGRRQQAQGPVQVPVSFQADSPILGSPIAAGTTVYFVSQNGTVYALDTSTGQQKWALSLPTKVTTSPALGGGVLFVTGTDGTVYAIE
jgi:outer membrane protein assembly factor BamB